MTRPRTMCLILSLLPNSICNQAASPVAHWLHTRVGDRLFQVLRQHRHGLSPGIVHIENASLLELNHENRVPILIDGLLDSFGSGYLHDRRDVLKCVPWDEEEEGEDKQAKDVPLK